MMDEHSMQTGTNLKNLPVKNLNQSMPTELLEPSLLENRYAVIAKNICTVQLPDKEIISETWAGSHTSSLE
jgi:hypothetical protein